MTTRGDGAAFDANELLRRSAVPLAWIVASTVLSGMVLEANRAWPGMLRGRDDARHALQGTALTPETLVTDPYRWYRTLRNRPFAVYHALRNATTAPDILVIGNSTANTNVDRALLSAKLALPPDRVLTAAFADATDLDVLALTPEITALRPRLVIYPVTVLAFDPAEPALQDTRLYHPAVSLRAFGFDELMRHASFHVSRTLEFLHPLTRHREIVRRLLLEKLFANRGKIVEPKSDERAAAERQAQRASRAELARLNAEDAAPCNAPFFQRLSLLQTALGRSGIDLLVVAAPIRFQVRDFDRLAKQLDRCLAERARVSKRFRVLSFWGRRPLGPALFRDSVHMNQSGRARMTLDIADALLGH